MTEVTSPRGQAMLSYVSPIYQNCREMTARTQAVGTEHDKLQLTIREILDQFYIETATWALDIWEKEFGIIVRPRDSNEVRRTRILTKLKGPGPFTLTAAKSLANVYSRNKTADCVNIPGQYAFQTIHEADDLIDLGGLKVAFEEMKPAHLEHIVGVLTKIHERISLSRQTLITVVRNPWINNQKDKVLDGTWALNGIKTMDRAHASPAPAITRITSLNIQRLNQYKLRNKLHGYILDGGPLLDGTWNLNGTITQINDPIVLTLAFILLRAIVQQPIATSAVSLTIPRFLNVRPGIFLDGGWLLGGQVNLSGIPDPPRPAFATSTTVRVARFIKTQGYILDGGPILSGAWNLSGAIIRNDDPIAQALGFVFLRTLEQQPIVASDINLTVPRYLNEKPGTYLDGGWLLNGQATLSGTIETPRPSFAFTTTNKVARFTKIQGHLLDGGIPLNGKWQMAGAVTKTDDPILTTITINGVAA